MPSEFTNRPLLDQVASYARRGPGHRDRLGPAEIEHIRRTVRRAPAVMVKVLTGGQPTMRGARDHLAYIGREGELDLQSHSRRIQKSTKRVRAYFKHRKITS